MRGDFMKRLITTFVVFSILVNFNIVWATPTGFSGGVNNEYEYEEIVFITGEPIKFVGKYTITERERDDEKTITYYFRSLKPEDSTIDATLNKRITFVTTYNRRNDKGQTIADTVVNGRATETIQIGNDRYTLEDIQFSKSDVIDNRPASDFYAGNIKMRKIYSINNGQGKVTVDATGSNVGYQNFWGNTETQMLDYVITYDRQVTVAGAEDETSQTYDLSWQGTVKVQVSDSTTKELKYSDNEANFSSFKGGYIRVTNREIVSKYHYNLPKMIEVEYGYNVAKIENGAPHKSRRTEDSIALSKKMVPKLERLIVPKFRDTGGHWAQKYIEKLYSLDVFDEDSQFFTPDAPMTRQEFTRGIIKACNIRPTLEEKKPTYRSRNQPKEESPFKDVNVEDPDYEYIKDGVDKGIIKGASKDLFKPGDPLTRAQAITILVRALGFENKAPNPGYYTSFSDDHKIPGWAKDSIYVAAEVGLINGDEYNNVNPNKPMSRAEASAMLVRFLEFLEKDLQRDYRENIIYFN
ncbi:MAG: hypothetical protein PWP27_1786 [Clostridiales bacterium]|jgi:hypothetical protein|nr:hypothetical protein [Clostridiales bacterium]